MQMEEKIHKNEGLARYCTFQIGGLADFFLEAATTEALLSGLEWARGRGLPYFVFGAGSNLLFDDSGFRGLVIRVKSDGLKVDGERITADSGVLVAKVVKAATDAGLTGLEAWNGLPGTVGGAVYGNAGCFGLEAKDVLESAEVFFPGEGKEGLFGSRRVVGVDFFEYGYRSSSLKEDSQLRRVVLSATFKLQKGEPSAIKARMMEVAKSRIQKQPAGSSTGSFFKNPSIEQTAGWLIEQCGLKGKRIGGAQISEHHGNFFLNSGKITARDVLALADFAQNKVLEKFGVSLEREVIYLQSNLKTA